MRKITRLNLAPLFILMLLAGCCVNNYCTNVEPDYLNLYNLNDQACFPDKEHLTYERIIKFNNANFKNMQDRLFPQGLDIYGTRDHSFIIEGDTLLIGLSYTYYNLTAGRSQSGLILVDSLGTIVKHSNREYYAIKDQTSFKNSVYMSYTDINNSTNQYYWNLLFSRNSEVSDSTEYKSAYYDIQKALVSSKIIDSVSEPDNADAFFGTHRSYVYDYLNMKLYSYDTKSKLVSTYRLPKNNVILQKCKSRYHPGLDVIFRGVVNNFIVFSSRADWVTLLVAMNTDNVYAFYTTDISDQLGIKGVKQFEMDYSGYRLYATENYLYLFLDLENGDFYTIQMKLNS